MLCPEVWDFSPPKIFINQKKFEETKPAEDIIKMNNFYRSVIITCPDEIQTPNFIKECLSEDTDYYKITNCSLTEFLNPVFIENFVKNGHLYCLSDVRNCMVDSCAAITPDGILTIHVPAFVYRTLGVEGKKRAHWFYDITINLKKLKHNDKIKNNFKSLEPFDFYISWVPNSENVCPSSIAKYLCDRNINVSLHSITFQTIVPEIDVIPTIDEEDIEDLTEWIGLLALECDVTQSDTYFPLVCEEPIKSKRLCLLIARGFITPNIISNVIEAMSKYTSTRELSEYWTSLSVQSIEESLWRWNVNSPRMFQSHNCSRSIFFTHSGTILFSAGLIKFS